jgi:hypothetical protein
MTFSAFSFQQKFVLIILSISIFLMLLFVGREFMRYQNIEKEMKKFSQKNIFLQEEITHLKDDIFYFRTENYYSYRCTSKRKNRKSFYVTKNTQRS